MNELYELAKQIDVINLYGCWYLRHCKYHHEWYLAYQGFHQET